MHFKFFVLIIGIFCLASSEANPFLELRDALEFNNAHEKSIDKRLFYTAKEQRREAKENYEEKCERKLLSAALNKPRWCPPLETWPAWNGLVRNEGINPHVKPHPLNYKPGYKPGYNPYNHNNNPGNFPNNFFNQNSRPNNIPFNANNYPFNQNGNIQFNNQYKPNQPQFPFKNN